MSGVSSTEYYRTLLSDMENEFFSIGVNACGSIVVAAAHIVSIVTLGYFDKLNAFVDEYEPASYLFQNMFLVIGVCSSADFRENLGDTNQGYRSRVGFGYSQRVQAVDRSGCDTRMKSLICAWQLLVASIQDFSHGCFQTMNAALQGFSNQPMNEEAIVYLAGLDGLCPAMSHFRNAVAITPSWAQNT